MKIEKIQKGVYDIVIVVNMLREGFDYPPFSIAGIVTRIMLITKFSQFVGRIQRVVRHEEEEEDGVSLVISLHTNISSKESCIHATMFPILRKMKTSCWMMVLMKSD